jgi:hypothetical protein
VTARSRLAHPVASTFTGRSFVRDGHPTFFGTIAAANASQARPLNNC